jgi:hypothetical protein
LHLTQVRTFVIALMAGAVILLAASPAGAIKPDFERTKPHVSAHIDLEVLADGTLVAEGGDGTLVLPPEIAPPSERTWLLSDVSGLKVEGEIVRGQLLIDRVIANFHPAAADARGVPGVITVMVMPQNEPCSSGPGNAATAYIVYDGETLTAAARTACQRARGHQDFNFIMHADKSTHALRRAGFWVSRRGDCTPGDLPKSHGDPLEC